MIEDDERRERIALVALHALLLSRGQKHAPEPLTQVAETAVAIADMVGLALQEDE